MTQVRSKRFYMRQGPRSVYAMQAAADDAVALVALDCPVVVGTVAFGTIKSYGCHCRG